MQREALDWNIRIRTKKRFALKEDWIQKILSAQQVQQ